MSFWMFSFPGWFWYLLNVWDRQELLQPGQEVQHEHLQRAVVFGPEIRGKHVLEFREPSEFHQFPSYKS